MSKKNSTMKTLDNLIEEEYGAIGSSKRDKFEEGYESFKVGFLIQQARIEKGLTQQELAEKCGTTKG
jgi:HTH-type transcriptional regulator/antitoxin HipB